LSCRRHLLFPSVNPSVLKGPDTQSVRRTTKIDAGLGINPM
jgi:hypothetical protein